MSFFQWRRFNFFDICKDVDKGAISSRLGEENVLTCCCAGRGNLVLGDLVGNIYRVLTRHWNIHTFRGWEGKVEELVQPRQAPVLLGLGIEAGVRCLKVWNLDKWSEESGGPQVVRVSRLTIPGSAAQPNTLAVSENLQLLAVGYDEGSLVLHRGEVTKERGSRSKQLLEGGQGQVTGLAFKVLDTGLFLYVATTRDILLFNVTTRDKEVKSNLDTLGCPSKGLVAAPPAQANSHLVVGQSDAIYCYNSEGRGQCYAMEGRKRSIHWWRGYLSVVTQEETDKATVTVLDVQNKFIGFSAPVKPVLGVLAEWGSILLVTQEGKVHQLVEKDTETKLSILFKKNFYDVAIKIARNQGVDREGLVDIFRQYGDHLYNKGDQQGAIEQYVKTIGGLEPSYVIQKFLDAQKIHNLTAYLQALHREGLASADHTTLLLNCYTKLKDGDKLDEFIMTKDRDVDFDVDVAISVCRQAGYHAHALALASKHSKHAQYLAISLESKLDYQAALAYLKNLERDEALLHLQKYGPTLMKELPGDTTSLLKSLCVAGEGKGTCAPDNFIPLFVNDKEGMVQFLSYLVDNLPQGCLSSTVYSTLLSYSLYSWTPDSGLEASKKILELLRSPHTSEHSNCALLLCQEAGFTAGLLYLYQEAGLHQQILAHHALQGDWDSIIQAARRYGPGNPQLWVCALQQVAVSGCQLEHEHLREVLDSVEKYRLLSPLQVVSTLSKCPGATLGLVRDYLLRILAREQKSSKEDERVIAEYKKESQAVRQKIEAINTSVTIFQSQACAACHQPLELPTVHFLCGHGYHQHCFQSYSDSDQECPACQPSNARVVALLSSQAAHRSNHEEFHSHLEKAEDGFSMVAEYLGRGLFAQSADLSSLPAAVLAQQQASNSEARVMSEARLRLEERQIDKPYQQQTDARLRLEERQQRDRSYGLQTEARLRAAGGARGQSAERLSSGQTEARLRATQPLSTGSHQPSEGRLRAEAATNSGVSQQTEARLRQQELKQGARGTSRERSYSPGQGSGVGSGSLASNMSSSIPQRQMPAASSFSPPNLSVPKREDIPAANPFGTPDSDSLGEENPFASSPKGGNTPFRRSVSPLAKSPTNPFGDGSGEYDEDLNPFAE